MKKLLLVVVVLLQCQVLLAGEGVGNKIRREGVGNGQDAVAREGVGNIVDHTKSGGTVIRSTTEQVISAIALAENDIEGVFAEIQKEMKQQGDALSIKDPELRLLFSAMLEGQYPQLKPGRYISLQSRHPELDQTPVMQAYYISHSIRDEKEAAKKCNAFSVLHKDAYVVKNSFGSDICYNIQGLRRIPLEGLRFQLTSLVVHELAHEFFGAGEEKPRKIQEFINHKLLSDCAIQFYVSNTWGEKGTKQLIVYPKRWNYDNLHDNIVYSFFAVHQVEAIFAFLHGPEKVVYPGYAISDDVTSTIRIDTNNSDTEMTFSLVEQGTSWIKFMAMDDNHNRNPITISWPAVRWGDSGENDSIVVSGKMNGKPLRVDTAWPSSACFY